MAGWRRLLLLTRGRPCVRQLGVARSFQTSTSGAQGGDDRIGLLGFLSFGLRFGLEILGLFSRIWADFF